MEFGQSSHCVGVKFGCRIQSVWQSLGNPGTETAARWTRGIDNMLMLMTSILATTLLAQSPDSIFVSGVVVDAAGKPLSDVDVVLPARRPPDGSLPTLAHTMTDEKGAFRLEITRQRFQDIGLVPFIWAYRPGRSVAVRETVITEKAAMPPVRLTLAEPLPRTVTILGPDDRPLAGVRVVPVSYALDGGPAVPNSRRSAGTLDDYQRCRWGGHASLFPDDARSVHGAGDRPGHRPPSPRPP